MLKLDFFKDVNFTQKVTVYPSKIEVNGLANTYTVNVKSEDELKDLRNRVIDSWNNSVCSLSGGYCGGVCSEFDCYHP